jgi:two-component system alkaline phosphatase synthesis response regulator PhoP
MNRNILLVEDEPGLVLTLGDRLRNEGYRVEAAFNGIEAEDRIARDHVDLVILDLMLPGKDGLEVCRELRHRGFSTPILMLTARGQTADKVLGLRIGADDYLAKPFEMLELLARVEALLRRVPRPSAVSSDVFDFGPLQVDLLRAEVLRGSKPVALSAKEFQLLRYLIEHRGVALTCEELVKEVWGYTAVPSTRTVDVHVPWLRQKVETDPKQPRLIMTVHGLGYKFAG